MLNRREFLEMSLLATVTSGPALARIRDPYDVAVYGATACGVIAAVAAAREGARVVLLEPGRHLGGMVSGGLSRTDYGRKETIGGYSLEFFQRLGKRYHQAIAWFFEPHLAEEVFKEMLAEAGVTVRFGQRLRERNAIRSNGANLEAMRMEDGTIVRARVFVDATYEGDLVAQAGVPYAWGREGTAQYGESLAGVRPKDKHHQFDVPVSARDARGRLLPEVQSGPRGEIGAADKKVQAYNFRLCLSSDPRNSIPYPRPRDYDPGRYELLARLLASLTAANGRPPRMDEITSPLPIPNQKVDVNNSGAFSTDHIGASWDYPEAGYARRAAIWQDHAEYTQGFFYFLARDRRVPKPLQEEINRWGLAADEFASSGHWPHQLYIREARRMVSDFVMTQSDIQTDLKKDDCIGMGSYNSDSHNVQRFVQADGTAQNEGNMEVPVTPYQIPYRVMLPRRRMRNLLVPVCVSASHVSYSTLRMEPVYMILGQAAGVAAKMAVDSRRAVEDIDTRELTAKLRRQGAVMEWDPEAEEHGRK